jgi:hypothetical protein
VGICVGGGGGGGRLVEVELLQGALVPATGSLEGASARDVVPGTLVLPRESLGGGLDRADAHGAAVAACGPGTVGTAQGA